MIGKLIGKVLAMPVTVPAAVVREAGAAIDEAEREVARVIEGRKG